MLRTISDLEILQVTEKLSDAKFAGKFGYHRTSWIRIRSGKTKRPINFLIKVATVYPGLKRQAREDLEKILSSNATNSRIS